MEAFVYCVQNSLFIALSQFLWVWYLAQYIFLYGLLLIIFVRVGRGSRIALVMYCDLSL